LIIAGNIQKHTISHRESICIPKVFSSSVRSFFVLATLPSNKSNAPENMRQNIAALILESITNVIPITEDIADK
jgi:hypothetical protein